MTTQRFRHTCPDLIKDPKSRHMLVDTEFAVTSLSMIIDPPCPLLQPYHKTHSRTEEESDTFHEQVQRRVVYTLSQTLHKIRSTIQVLRRQRRHRTRIRRSPRQENLPTLARRTEFSPIAPIIETATRKLLRIPRGHTGLTTRAARWATQTTDRVTSENPQSHDVGNRHQRSRQIHFDKIHFKVRKTRPHRVGWTKLHRTGTVKTLQRHPHGRRVQRTSCESPNKFEIRCVALTNRSNDIHTRTTRRLADPPRQCSPTRLTLRVTPDRRRVVRTVFSRRCHRVPEEGRLDHHTSHGHTLLAVRKGRHGETSLRQKTIDVTQNARNRKCIPHPGNLPDHTSVDQQKWRWNGSLFYSSSVRRENSVRSQQTTSRSHPSPSPRPFSNTFPGRVHMSWGQELDNVCTLGRTPVTSQTRKQSHHLTGLRVDRVVHTSTWVVAGVSVSWRRRNPCHVSRFTDSPWN